MTTRLDAICPKCNGTTDTGGECSKCGFDWQNDSRTEKEKYVDEWQRLEVAFITKEDRKRERAAFLLHNQYGSTVNYYPYDIK